MGRSAQGQWQSQEAARAPHVPAGARSTAPSRHVCIQTTTLCPAAQAQPSEERCFSSAGTPSAPLPCLTLLKPRALLPFTGKSLFPRKGPYNERQTGLFWESVRLVRHQEFSLYPLSAFGGVACCSTEQHGQVEVRALSVLSFPFIYTAPACSGSPHVEAFPSAFLLTSGFRVLFVQSKLRVSLYLGAKLGQKSPQKHE